MKTAIEMTADGPNVRNHPNPKGQISAAAIAAVGLVPLPLSSQDGESSFRRWNASPSQQDAPSPVQAKSPETPAHRLAAAASSVQLASIPTSKIPPQISLNLPSSKSNPTQPSSIASTSSIADDPQLALSQFQMTHPGDTSAHAKEVIAGYATQIKLVDARKFVMSMCTDRAVPVGTEGGGVQVYIATGAGMVSLDPVYN